jgi:hypothetical protein
LTSSGTDLKVVSGNPHGVKSMHWWILLVNISESRRWLWTWLRILDVLSTHPAYSTSQYFTSWTTFGTPLTAQETQPRDLGIQNLPNSPSMHTPSWFSSAGHDNKQFCMRKAHNFSTKWPKSSIPHLCHL